MSEDNKPETKQDNKPHFALQKIYLKDLSFESPRPVETLLKTVERADINFQLNSDVRRPAEDVYEVTLTITVTARKEDTVLYLVEVKQAGLFTLGNFPEEELAAMLNSYCPAILFPYAREVVSSMVERGGFPQLLLKPINFDAIYLQYLEKQAQQKATA
ncbi:MAG TPA: protein-export chaperone SecB [Gammaproteobacteria bacterium]